MEYYNKYYTMRDRSQSTAVDSFILLDNKQVLVAHDDYIVRLFDMQTGKMLPLFLCQALVLCGW